MPRKNLDEHFESERPEWTRRKHDLLARYVVPAAMKMRRGPEGVALVDGYAGVNAYGTEATGSTVIMLRAARQVRETGSIAKVFACEPDPKRYELLCSNLASEISEGLLHPYNGEHSTALPTIMRAIGNTPSIVFLDPQTVTQMTLVSDILPWVERPRTDILGVFMATQACRCCAQYIAGGQQRVVPEAYLGPDWRSGASEDGAVETFLAALGDRKKFKGMYRLRKKEMNRYAYGIFGLSDHVDGYWLLSNAVAKDYGALKDYDYTKEQQENLFAEEERDEEQREAFEMLIEISRETILRHQKLRGAELATHLFSHGIGVQELFGAFEESDFTSASYHVLQIPDRRKGAKTKQH